MRLFFNEKTPLLGEGGARSVMTLILYQLKFEYNRGLTHFIEKYGGVNGKWLKPDEPYDMRWSKLSKILEAKAQYQEEDEFMDDWEQIGRLIFKLSRKRM